MVAQRRVFGVPPSSILLVIAFGALGLAIALFATGRWPWGLIVLGRRALHVHRLRLADETNTGRVLGSGAGVTHRTRLRPRAGRSRSRDGRGARQREDRAREASARDRCAGRASGASSPGSSARRSTEEIDRPRSNSKERIENLDNVIKEKEEKMANVMMEAQERIGRAQLQVQATRILPGARSPARCRSPPVPSPSRRPTRASRPSRHRCRSHSRRRTRAIGRSSRRFPSRARESRRIGVRPQESLECSNFSGRQGRPVAAPNPGFLMARRLTLGLLLTLSSSPSRRR